MSTWFISSSYKRKFWPRYGPRSPLLPFKATAASLLRISAYRCNKIRLSLSLALCSFPILVGLHTLNEVLVSLCLYICYTCAFNSISFSHFRTSSSRFKSVGSYYIYVLFFFVFVFYMSVLFFVFSFYCFRLRIRQVQHSRRSPDGHQQFAREPDHAREYMPHTRTQNTQTIPFVL